MVEPGDTVVAASRSQAGAGRGRQWFPWGVGNPTFYLTLLVLVAIVGVAFIATQGSAAVAVAAGIASFMVGGTFGFIFGIPRYATSASEREIQSAQAGVVKYKANTNLEQISDWLTKILVGLGLTQFPAIASFFSSVSAALGEALLGSTGTTASVTAAALIVLTIIPGFIFFYLWSRVYLPRMFQEAEADAGGT